MSGRRISEFERLTQPGSRTLPDDDSIPVLTERLALPSLDIDTSLPTSVPPPTAAEEAREGSAPPPDTGTAADNTVFPAAEPDVEAVVSPPARAADDPVAEARSDEPAVAAEETGTPTDTADTADVADVADAAAAAHGADVTDAADVADVTDVSNVSDADEAADLADAADAADVMKRAGVADRSGFADMADPANAANRTSSTDPTNGADPTYPTDAIAGYAADRATAESLLLAATHPAASLAASDGTPPVEAPLDWTDIEARARDALLRELQPRLASELDRQLRERLQPAVVRMLLATVTELRPALEAAVRDSVARVVAAEVARQRSRT